MLVACLLENFPFSSLYPFNTFHCSLKCFSKGSLFPLFPKPLGGSQRLIFAPICIRAIVQDREGLQYNVILYLYRDNEFLFFGRFVSELWRSEKDAEVEKKDE